MGFASYAQREPHRRRSFTIFSSAKEGSNATVSNPSQLSQADKERIHHEIKAEEYKKRIVSLMMIPVAGLISYGLFYVGRYLLLQYFL